ncbi:hypothetical protein DFS34DRAFT_598936 [Phlyctochytrium arcticum]|nr:hypothetical protein DFS34DRAFT_598936 [Phlyctochytrium arcticum]
MRIKSRANFWLTTLSILSLATSEPTLATNLSSRQESLFSDSKFANGSLEGFWTYEEIVSNTQKLANDQPQLVQFSSIGKSLQEREIPAILITDRDDTKVPIDQRPSIVFAGALRGDEPLTVAGVLQLIQYLTTQRQNDSLVNATLASTRLWFVPVVNVDRWAGAKTVSSLTAKNARSGCGADATKSGVDLSRNWGYMWDTYLPNRELAANKALYEDECSDAFHGKEPFSEPETNALQKLIMEVKPASVAFLRQDNAPTTSSGLVIPYTYHPSNISIQHNQFKIMRPDDSAVYQGLGAEANKAVGGKWVVGTGWEVWSKTISGSEVDWAFDQANAFAVMVRMKEPLGSTGIEATLNQYLKGTLALAHHARTLPPKTAKPNKSSIGHRIGKAVTLGPLVLGLILTLILLAAYATARFLGYDKIWDRFTFFVHRMRRWRTYSKYKGLASTAKEGDEAEEEEDWGFELDDGGELGYRA